MLLVLLCMMNKSYVLYYISYWPSWFLYICPLKSLYLLSTSLKFSFLAYQLIFRAIMIYWASGICCFPQAGVCMSLCSRVQHHYSVSMVIAESESHRWYPEMPVFLPEHLWSVKALCLCFSVMYRFSLSGLRWATETLTWRRGWSETWSAHMPCSVMPSCCCPPLNSPGRVMTPVPRSSWRDCAARCHCHPNISSAWLTRCTAAHIYMSLHYWSSNVSLWNP